MQDVTVEPKNLRLLDVEEPQLWHTAGQDCQCGFGYSGLVQAELREAGRS